MARSFKSGTAKKVLKGIKKKMNAVANTPVGKLAKKRMTKKTLGPKPKKAVKPIGAIKTVKPVKGRHAGKGNPGMIVKGKPMKTGPMAQKAKKKVRKTGGGTGGGHFGMN